MTNSPATPATGPYLARGTVTTELAPRYIKQMAAHFGHKAEIQHEAEGPRIVLTGGSCLLVAGATDLELHVSAETLEALNRVKKVLGSHLERFGQRDSLTVVWSDSAPES